MKLLVLGLNYAPEPVGIGPFTAGLAEGMALIASITLKPSRSPATRTWPKLSFNTAS